MNPIDRLVTDQRNMLLLYTLESVEPQMAAYKHVVEDFSMCGCDIYYPSMGVAVLKQHDVEDFFCFDMNVPQDDKATIDRDLYLFGVVVGIMNLLSHGFQTGNPPKSSSWEGPDLNDLVVVEKTDSEEIIHNVAAIREFSDEDLDRMFIGYKLTDFAKEIRQTLTELHYKAVGSPT